MKQSKIIAVDLDGTLTLTDTLHEAVLSLVSKKPYFIFWLPIWLFKGIAHLKQKVGEHSEFDVRTLPFNQPFIDWLIQPLPRRGAGAAHEGIEGVVRL